MKVADHCRSCGKEIAPLPLADALCTICRYHDAPAARAWNTPDEYGNPAPPEPDGVVDFAFPEAAKLEGQHAAEVRAALAEFLTGFARLSPLAAGRRVLLLSYWAGKSDCRTDAEMASRLGISATRFSHLKREFSPTFASLARLGQRQRKRQKRNVAPWVNERSI